MHEMLMPELLELQIAERRAEATAHRLAKSGSEAEPTRRFTWTGLKWRCGAPKLGLKWPADGSRQEKGCEEPCPSSPA